MIIQKIVVWMLGCMIGLKLYEWFAESLQGSCGVFTKKVYKCFRYLLISMLAINTGYGYYLIFSTRPLEMAVSQTLGIGLLCIALVSVLLLAKFCLTPREVKIKNVATEFILGVLFGTGWFNAALSTIL